jgi:hypothetical protein
MRYKQSLGGLPKIKSETKTRKLKKVLKYEPQQAEFAAGYSFSENLLANLLT